MHLIGSTLGDDVDDAPGRTSEFCIGATRHHLELLHRIQRDVDRCPLAAELLAKKPVVVITAIQTYVVEDSALAVEVNFITIRTLHNAHPGGQG